MKSLTFTFSFHSPGLKPSHALENSICHLPFTDASRHIYINKLQYKRTEWGVEKDGTDNSRAIKDELTLKDIDVTYSKTDTDNGINEEISKEIVAQINAEKV